MPRKPAATNVVALDTRAVRLRPPPDLPQPERDLFARLIAANAPTHFKESDLPLLTQYCENVVLNKKAAAELRAAPLTPDGKASPWLVIAEKTHRACVALSMRLRVCPQSRQANNPSRPAPRLSAYEMEALRREEN
jgi:hypothetical protein